MTATYDEATAIYSSSRVTYDGGADDTVGVGHAPSLRTTWTRPALVAPRDGTTKAAARSVAPSPPSVTPTR